MSQPVLIAPSVLASDLSRLRDEVVAVAEAGADWIHLDVMDGRFVPNLTFGAPVVKALRGATSLPLDAHLMVEDADSQLEAFADAGVEHITVHAEACTHLQRTLARIRDLGCRAGVALNPHTSPELLEFILDDLDLVLVMSVNPGFGGQAFLPSALAKISRIAELIGERPIRLQVDGGVAVGTAKQVVAAGADTLVAGSAIFRHNSYTEAIASIRADLG